MIETSKQLLSQKWDIHDAVVKASAAFAQLEPEERREAERIFIESFKLDVRVFCWLPHRLLTGEVAWLRTVFGRRRRGTGEWEYYNAP